MGGGDCQGRVKDHKVSEAVSSSDSPGFHSGLSDQPCAQWRRFSRIRHYLKLNLADSHSFNVELDRERGLLLHIRRKLGMITRLLCLTVLQQACK